MYHLCHISTTFNLRSGSARRTSAILKGCLGKGYKVSLIIGRDHDVIQEDVPGVDIYVVPELVKYISPWLDMIVPWKLKIILNSIKPDLVHTHLAKAGIVGRLAAWNALVPYVMHTVHGPTFPKHFHPVKRFLFRVLEQFCGRFTDRFVFVGHQLQEEYIAAGICSKDMSCVIQTGRPDSVFDRIVKSEAAKQQLRSELCAGKEVVFLFVTVGRLVPAKQLDHAIRIIKLLHKQGVQAHLAIVGKCLLAEEQQYEEKLLKLSHEIGINEYVHFAGFRDDIIDIMEIADAVLLTSRYEGLPNVAVEAVISGTPMVTYDVSGVQEVIDDGKSGWIVPQGDMEQAADRLLQLAKIRQKSVGSEKFDSRDDKKMECFHESVMVARKIQLYKQCLNGSNGLT